jgi:hypothetical protein
MSKAIAGAAMIAADLAIGLTLMLNPALLVAFGPLMMNVMNGLIVGLFAGGVSLEAGAAAEALTGQRGMGITTRLVAGLRQIIYGQQRLGGVILYQSTTGAGGASGNYVYNFVIALATHEIDAVINVYLDGRQVFWRQDGNAANVGCGSVYKSSTPGAAGPLVPVLTCTCTIAGGAVTGITYTGTPTGYSNVKAARYRVRIVGGGGSGATAYATNSGTGPSPVFTVHVTAGGSGYTSPPFAEIQGAYVFGGMAAADEQDPAQPGYGIGYGIAPSGSHYNFSGKVFAEVRFGDQLPGDYMASLSANDSAWPSTANVGGCAYMYLGLGYDTQLFPSLPEIRITVNGKNTILDPRSGLRGFTANWALQVADVLADADFGLGDNSVNTAQLIAAANVCDELVTTASQGSETRYAQHLHYDTSTGPGDALQLMMSTAAGRLGRIGGEWWIWPAYWQGPSFSFGVGDLIDAPQWVPYRSFKELFNRVSGTYTAPNYPYNIAGNLYDRNGWYYGTRDDAWPLAWQPTNFPEYAADPIHGYASDAYLAQDGGKPLPKELQLRGVISIVQAQRVAKITLMRNRFQGSGSFAMSVQAWKLQPTDVVQFTWNIFGWTNKLLEVEAAHFRCEARKRPDSGGDDDEDVLALWVELALIETDPTIYEWATSEELTVYDVEAAPAQIGAVPAAPTGFTVTSSAATAVIGADGIVIPRAQLTWDAPQDVSITTIQIQYKAHTASAWNEAGSVDVGLFVAFVAGVVAGQSYDFRIRSIRRAGVWSAWVEVDNAVISITLSNTTGTGYTVAPPGTLSAQALSDGTAQITINAFTAVWGGLSASCAPSPHILSALAQAQLYYEYYVDPNFAGGAITPIATGDPNDFVNKPGYFLIGSIVTPSYTPRYEPSIAHDVGQNSTANPSAAFDNDVTTDAIVQATVWSTYSSGVGLWIPSAAGGDCIWSGFPNFTPTSALTLHVLCGADVQAGTTCSLTVIAHVGSTDTTLATFTGTSGKTDYTLSIAAGTNLNTISVEAVASITAPSPGSTNISQWAHLEGFEIYIQ